MLFYMLPFHSFKQWGINKAGLESPIPFNISFKKTARIVAIPVVLSTALLAVSIQYINDKASVNEAVLDIKDNNGESREELYVQWFSIGA